MGYLFRRELREEIAGPAHKEQARLDCRAAEFTSKRDSHSLSAADVAVPKYERDSQSFTSASGKALLWGYA